MARQLAAGRAAALGLPRARVRRGGASRDDRNRLPASPPEPSLGALAGVRAGPGDASGETPPPLPARIPRGCDERRPGMRHLARLGPILVIATWAGGCDLALGTPPEPPEVVSVSSPRVAFSSEGNAIIAYAEATSRGFEQRQRLRLETYSTAEGRLTGSTFIERGNFQNSVPVAGIVHTLAADASGTAQTIYTSRLQRGFFPDGFWGCRSTVDAPQWACSRLPRAEQDFSRDSEWATRVALNGGGAALALTSSTDSGLVLRSLVRSSLGDWSTPQTIAEGVPLSSSPTLTYSASGIGFALYTDSAGQLVARRYVGGQWEGPLNLAGSTGVDSPRLVQHRDAPASTAMALWREQPGTPERIRAARFVSDATPGWSFTPPVPGSECAQSLDAAMAPSGDVLVVWVCETGALSGLVLASRYSNAAWSTTPEEIGVAPSLDGQPKVAVDAQGNAAVVWHDATQLFAASRTLAEGWRQARPIGALVTPPSESDYDLAMDDAGRALAVWVYSVGANSREGTRLGVQEVGPYALTLTAPSHAFGGEPIPVTVRLGVAPLQATTVTLATVLPSGSVPRGTILFYPGQTQATANVASDVVDNFVDGRVEATYGGLRSSTPITLMPEPTAMAMRVSPESVLGGETTSLRVEITPSYPPDLDVQLESDSTLAPVPTQVTSHNSLATVPVTTQTTTVEQTVVFTARFRALSATASLLVNPTPFGQSVLTVTILEGQGTVSSNPAGLTACASSCSASYSIGTPVTLIPSPAPGFRFMAWEGHPDCNDSALTMSSARDCGAIFLPVLPPDPGGEGWTFLGTPLIGQNLINPSPALALDGIHPVVAYLTRSSPGTAAQLFVQRLEGGAFAPLGTAALNVDVTHDASEPAMVTTNDGLPYLAWIEGSGAQQNLYVARLAFGGVPHWVPVGARDAPLNYVSGSHAASPSIALDAELRPMVAWIENGAVKFKRFDGTGWVPAEGGEGPVSAAADRVRMSSFAGGAPVIAWTQGSGPTRALKVARDFTFASLGTQVNPASVNPLTEFTVLGEPGGAVVSWGDGESPFYVRAHRWDGTAWVNVASNQVINNNPNRLVGIAMARDAATVAYAYASLAADTSNTGTRRVSSGIWVNITPDINGTRDANVGPIAVELATPASPIVAFVSRNPLGDYTWRVARWY